MDKSNYFLDILKKIFSLFSGEELETKEENEKLSQLGDNPEEKDAITAICDEIDSYHEEIQTMNDDNIDEDRMGEYTKYRLLEFAKENEPDLTVAELDEFSDDIDIMMEGDILTTSVDIANEIAGEDVDTTEIESNEE